MENEMKSYNGEYDGRYLLVWLDDELKELDRQLWRPPYPGYESEGARLAYKLTHAFHDHQTS